MTALLFFLITNSGPKTNLRFIKPKQEGLYKVSGRDSTGQREEKH